jgi:hypothetical protein
MVHIMVGMLKDEDKPMLGYKAWLALGMSTVLCCIVMCYDIKYIKRDDMSTRCRRLIKQIHLIEL